MINKRRVQLIKSLIYAFIILFIFLPLILMAILSFQMFGAIKDLNVRVDNLSELAATEEQPSKSSEDRSALPDGEYVIEPDNQSNKPVDTVEQEPEAPETTAADESNLSSETLSAKSPVEQVAEEKPFQTEEGNELGGGAPLEGSDEYLAAAGAASPVATTEGELAANPQMGIGDNSPSLDYTANPSTGA